MCVTEYKITNTSEDVYYSWLDYEKPKYSERDVAIRHYFFKAKGDFSFFNLMTDNVIFVDDDLLARIEAENIAYDPEFPSFDNVDDLVEELLSE